MWGRFGWLVLSLTLLWGAEEAWLAHGHAVAMHLGRQPGWMLLAFGLQILAGTAAGLAIREKVDWTGYRTSHAVTVGLLPFLMMVMLFVIFGLGLSAPESEVFSKIAEIPSQLRRVLGILVGLGIVAGFEPGSSAAQHPVQQSPSE